MAKHIVLVHGAWQGSWSFDLIKPLLEQTGWTVHALDLPDNGWNTKIQFPANQTSYCEFVVEAIQQIGEPVVLLGHSGGGLTISAVAERIPDLIKSLVYLVGMMLPSEMSFLDFKKLCEQYFPDEDFAGISPYLTFTEEGYSIVSHEGAKKIFLQDCEAVLAEHLIDKLRPQPETGRDLKPTLTFERFGTVPRIYVEAVYDQSLSINMQRLMQQLQPKNLQVITMRTGHVPQAVQPKLLVEKLNQRFTETIYA
ncbi:alpha/beta fold hydrolase [Acinetobacter sp. S40]|uniref:alpha/beta fold hydrolase n=1 Tax=unclassified Acinetobacter TaxID=196816 RepID=UPI00190CADB7|nr:MULTISPECIES: alpha/beta fold hydrolase [unclassified Acinetobacter]MBJ9985992.1 alpha/beta fold hydrolase [Acinetobacter sp. S40]MBK0064496.1 alpha/beta fold hydrolase [Acinetobacter sp. S55]MBK0067194.1 alpha/beta fold hydrolase [Acinetobacter sp. S54]